MPVRAVAIGRRLELRTMVRAISSWTLALPRIRESDIVLVMVGRVVMHPSVRQRGRRRGKTAEQGDQKRDETEEWRAMHL
jgi:hypothetical protein